MLTRLSFPPVIYHDLVMEKLHFPDTGVVMGPLIPGGGGEPRVRLQVRGVPRPPQPGEATPCACIGHRPAGRSGGHSRRMPALA